MAEKFPYLARQINGNIAKMFGYGIDHVYEKDQDFIDFISSFSIDKLDGEWLDQLGAILGIARPQIDGSLYHKFLFYGPVKNPSAEVIAYMKAHGFSDGVNVSDPEYGGLLDDVVGTEYTPIDDDLYKTYIKSCCALRNNHAFLNICAVVESIVGTQGYEVEFFKQGDTYGGELVASGDIHILLDKGMIMYEETLAQLFKFVMTTNPRVFVGIGDEGIDTEDFIFYMLPDNPNDDQRRYAEVHGMSDRVNTSESGNGGFLGDTDSGDYDDGTVPYDPTEGNFVFFELPENPTQEQIEYAQAHGFSDGVNTSSEGYGGFLPDVSRQEFQGTENKYQDALLFTRGVETDAVHGFSNMVNSDLPMFGGLMSSSLDEVFLPTVVYPQLDGSIDWSEKQGLLTFYQLPKNPAPIQIEWAQSHGFSDGLNTNKSGFGGWTANADSAEFESSEEFDMATAFILSAENIEDAVHGLSDVDDMSRGGLLTSAEYSVFDSEEVLKFRFTDDVEESDSGFSNFLNIDDEWFGGLMSDSYELAPSIKPMDNGVDWSEAQGDLTFYRLSENPSPAEAAWGAGHGFADNVNTDEGGQGGWMSNSSSFDSGDVLQFVFDDDVQVSQAGFSNFLNIANDWFGGLVSEYKEEKKFVPVAPIVPVGTPFLYADENPEEDSEHGFANGYKGAGGILERSHY